jgi:hypothetical protein
MSARNRVLKNLLLTLKTALHRVASRRRMADAAETANAEEDLAKTLANTDAPPPLEAGPGTTPPEARPSFWARLKFWRRKSVPDAEEATEAAKTSDTPPPTETAPPDADTPPAPPFLKRLLGLLLRKAVWMPAVGILLVAVGAAVSVSFMRGMQANQAKAMQDLEAAKLKLEQENQKLRTAQTLAPAPAAAAPASETKPPESVTSEMEAKQPSTHATSRAPGRIGGDCVVADREGVGTSLKDCIDAYNQAARGGKK